MKEKWKPIRGYTGIYEASNLGRIRALGTTIIKSNGRQQTSATKVLTPGIDSGGYPLVVLCKNFSKRSFRVHRIIGKLFVRNPNPRIFTQINHKDRERSNCRAKNLEWVSNRENGTHGVLQKKKSSIFIGVCKPKKGNKYQSTICINGKSVHLGLFTSEIDASLAYKNALVKNRFINRYAR
jgi:hypothetical protein